MRHTGKRALCWLLTLTMLLSLLAVPAFAADVQEQPGAAELTDAEMDTYIIPAHSYAPGSSGDTPPTEVDLSDKELGYSFNLYDESGPDSQYGSNWDGYLVLTLPEDLGLRLEGPINTESGYDLFYAYVGTTNNQVCSESGSKTIQLAFGESPVILRFRSDSSVVRDGLSLTGTLANKIPIALLPGEANGGPISSGVVEGANYTLPQCPFQLPVDKLFGGWLSSADGQIYQPGASVPISEFTSFTAQFVDAATASFAANGGSGSGPEPIVKLPGTVIRLPGCSFTPPEGKLFSAWSDGNELYSPNQEYTLNESVVFYAQWTDACTASFDANGGSGNGPAPIVRLPGTVIELPYCSFMSPAGKLFSAWSDGNELYSPNQEYTLNESVVFYAQWTDACIAHFDANGGIGTNVPQDQSVLPGSTIWLPSCYLTPPEGKVFGGWFDGTAVYPASTQYTMNSSVTFYAYWADALCASYDTLGGGEVAPASAAPGETIYLKGGSDFVPPYLKVLLGWTDGIAEYRPYASYTMNEDTLFTAVYTDGYQMHVQDNATVDLNGTHGIREFHVYDWGGPYGNYSEGYNTTLNLIPPAGKIVKISGTVNMDDYSSDYFYIYGDTVGNRIYTGSVNGSFTIPEFDASAYGTIIFRMTSDSYSNNYPGYDITLKFLGSRLYYDANGADSASCPEDTTLYVEERNTATVLGPGTMAREGYDFLGWNTEPDGSGENYAEGDSISFSDDMVLYAVWVKNAQFVAHEHDGVSFEPWGDTDRLPTAPGNWYLTDDVTLSSGWNVPAGDTNLCLNGKGITFTAGEGSVITVPGGAALNLFDCDDTEHPYYLDENDYGHLGTPEDSTLRTGTFTGGYITGGKGGYVKTVGRAYYFGGGALFIMAGGSCTMNGGNLIANTAGATYFEHYYTGGAGVWNSGSFTLNGGSILANKLYSGDNGGSTDGGGVATEGRFVMNGGSILYNATNTWTNTYYGSYGGGVAIIDGGYFNMNDGLIAHNISGDCGGVLVGGDGDFVLSGGSITDNVAVRYGSSSENISAVGQWYGRIKLSGAPVIQGNLVKDSNTLEYEERESNIFIRDGSLLEIVGPLSDGEQKACLGVNYENSTGEFTSGYSLYEGSVRPGNYFTSDDGYNVFLSEKGEAELGLEPIPYIAYRVDEESGELIREIKTVVNYSELQSSSNIDTNLSGGTYLVSGEVNIDGLLVAYPEGQGENAATVNLILCDDATLNVTYGFLAADGLTLNIYAQSEGEHAGTLHTAGGFVPGYGIYTAGIGGYSYGTEVYGDCAVNIHGGNIIADSSHSNPDEDGHSAGIGGAQNGSGVNVTIYGGNVTAIGGSGAAGIGGGSGGRGGSLSIYGGTVYAAGDENAMGIGAGENAEDNGALNLYPGVVILSSDDDTNWTNTTDDLSVRMRYMKTCDHQYSDWSVTTEPSCTEPGEESRVCSVCGRVETRPVDALGHTPGEPVMENQVDPSCTEAGSYELVTRCETCGEILASEHFTIDALGHDYVPAVTEPSCTEGGFTTYTCSRCGDSYVGDETAALGHQPGEPVIENYVEPTGSEGGGYDTVVYCQRCGEELSREHTALSSVDGPNADGYFYLNGEIVPCYQFVEWEGAWYFINDDDKYARDIHLDFKPIYVEGTPFEPGCYYFDAMGRLVIQSGPNSNGYFYLDGIRQKAYQLIEFEGAWYFITDGNRYAVNQNLYLNSRLLAGSPFTAGYYEFDENGRMVLKNGPQADGYFYLDGIKQLAYQLIEWNGDYYFINDAHKYARNIRLYLGRQFVAGSELAPGCYDFDDSGKLVLKNGPWEDGYFYINGARQSCYQLIHWEGGYYFINDGHKYAVNTRVYLSARFIGDEPISVGYHYFGADGKMTD